MGSSALKNRRGACGGLIIEHPRDQLESGKPAQAQWKIHPAWATRGIRRAQAVRTEGVDEEQI